MRQIIERDRRSRLVLNGAGVGGLRTRVGMVVRTFSGYCLGEVRTASGTSWGGGRRVGNVRTCGLMLVLVWLWSGHD
ncbi:hypothetical protein HHX47_DHR1000175, partial [Lentinula edodes]